MYANMQSGASCMNEEIVRDANGDVDPGVVVRDMEYADLNTVLEIERRCFPQI